MTGDLDNICNAFFTADVYLQFFKVHFKLLRGLIYQINSIEDNYISLSLPTNLPMWPSDDVTRGIPRYLLYCEYMCGQ